MNSVSLAVHFFSFRVIRARDRQVIILRDRQRPSMWKAVRNFVHAHTRRQTSLLLNALVPFHPRLLYILQKYLNGQRMFEKPLMWAKLCDAIVNCEGNSVCITFPISWSCFSLFLIALSLTLPPVSVARQKKRVPAIRYYVLWYSLLLCFPHSDFFAFLFRVSFATFASVFCACTEREWERKVKSNWKSEKKRTNSNWDCEWAEEVHGIEQSMCLLFMHTVYLN